MKADITLGKFEVVAQFENRKLPFSGVSVITTLYNYGHTIVEALESVSRQTLKGLEVIIVDDCSPDNGLEVVLEWSKENASRFSRFSLLRHKTNQGLAIARNTAVFDSSGDYFFVLDADNHMLPRCAELHRQALDENPAFSFAYAMIAEFGDSDGLIGTLAWDKELLAMGNYIDAMAMIRRSSWEAVGGYKKLRGIGWEDYELWLNFAQNEMLGVWIPNVLSRYRVHQSSMLRTQTKQKAQRKLLREELKTIYPWVNIRH